MRYLAVAIAIAAGLIVLISYFVPALAMVQSVLLNWAIILAGMAALVGVFNLISVHGDKVRRREKGNIYSAVLLVSLFASFIFGLALGPDQPYIRLLVNTVIVPVETALMALLSVTLLYASIRLLRRRTDVMSIVFLLTAVLMLAASATLPFGEILPLNNLIRHGFNRCLPSEGARHFDRCGARHIDYRLARSVRADRPYGDK